MRTFKRERGNDIFHVYSAKTLSKWRCVAKNLVFYETLSCQD
ncbi:hypothetical protein LG311_12870 [Sutcliffiella horikoshii]